MPEQTALDVTDRPPVGPGPCAWCGAPGAALLVLEKERYRMDRGIRVPAKHAIEVWVCADHDRSLARAEPAEGPEPSAVIKGA